MPVAGETVPVAFLSCTRAWRLMDLSPTLRQDLHSGDAGSHWQGQVGPSDASSGLWSSGEVGKHKICFTMKKQKGKR